MARRSPIPTAPTGPRPGSGGGGRPSSGGGGGGGGKPKPPPKPGAGAGKDSDGGSGSDPMADYQREQEKAKNAAADRYKQQIKNLQVQADALLHALKKDLKKGLDQQLGDINQIRDLQDKFLMEGYRQRVDMLAGADADNDKSMAGQSGLNVQNMARERNSAVSEAMNMGAGESDVLQAQMMSLRNWQANQQEVQRSYFDTLRSVNSSLTDLNVDTKTARINNEIQANADKEQLWTNYFNQRSELYTQLGNTYGQQADYFASIKEYGGGTGPKFNSSNPYGIGGGKGSEGVPGKGGKNDGKGGGGDKLKGQTGGGGKGLQVRGNQVGPGGRPMAGPGPKPGPEPKPGKGNDWGVSRPGQGNNDRDRDKDRGGKNDAPGKNGGKGDGKPGNNGGKGNGPDRGGGRPNPYPTPAGPGIKDPGPDNANEARNNAASAFLNAAETLGLSWDNPGLSKEVREWEGRADFAANTNLNKLQSAMTLKPMKAPEGATLRKW